MFANFANGIFNEQIAEIWLAFFGRPPTFRASL